MYDKLSVTPREYVSFIEFCDKGHYCANKHGSKMVAAVVVVGLGWSETEIGNFDS